MATRRSDLEDQIATLEKFETLYEEFLDARRQIDGVAWGNAERRWLDSDTAWARRRRELQELAPQAEAALVAASARRWDGGPVRIDLPQRIFRFTENNFGDPGDGEQRKLLEEFPTHIGALKGKLRAAPNTGLKHWDLDDGSASVTPAPIPAPVGAAPQPEKASWWHSPNPWVLYVVGGLITVVGGGLILAVILAA
jgi:hypothetical protein